MTAPQPPDPGSASAPRSVAAKPAPQPKGAAKPDRPAPFRQWRLFDRGLVISLAPAVLLLVVDAALSYWNTRQLNENVRAVVHSQEVLDSIHVLVGTMTDAETGERGYVITGDDAYLAPYQKARTTWWHNYHHLFILVSDDQRQHARLDEIKDTIDRKMVELEGVIETRKERGFDAAQQLVMEGTGLKQMDSLLTVTGAMEAEERGLLVERQLRSRNSYVIAITAAAATAVLGFALVILVFYLVRRHLEAQAKNAVVLEHRVEERTEQLAKANQELEAFSYSVSHDLRAPLRAMNGFSRLLEEDFGATLAPAGMRYLDLIQKNAQQMGSLIDDLLTFSRLSRQPLKKSTVAPDELAREVYDKLAPDRNGRTIEFTVESLPPAAADADLLRQVLVNLISNAIKYTRERPVAKIHIGSRADGETVYYIRDNGVGFDMRYVDKLFGVFQRLHRAEEYEGTGVGLAIVQRIVQRHGGRVWADATVGEGATFSFTLPEADHV